MRRRYRQKPDGSLEYVGVVQQAPYASNTFAVGDLKDIQKDVAQRKLDAVKRDKTERLNTIVNIVNNRR